MHTLVQSYRRGIASETSVLLTPASPTLADDREHHSTGIPKHPTGARSQPVSGRVGRYLSE
jgi:hypothetical protein